MKVNGDQGGSKTDLHRLRRDKMVLGDNKISQGGLQW